MTTKTITETLDVQGETFFKCKYNELELIIRKKDNFMNASKLCAKYGKRFSNLKATDVWNNEYMKGYKDGKDIYLLDAKYKLVQGYYVNPRLINIIAQWCSTDYREFVTDVMNGVNKSGFLTDKFTEFKTKYPKAFNENVKNIPYYLIRIEKIQQEKKYPIIWYKPDQRYVLDNSKNTYEYYLNRYPLAFINRSEYDQLFLIPYDVICGEDMMFYNELPVVWNENEQKYETDDSKYYEEDKNGEIHYKLCEILEEDAKFDEFCKNFFEKLEETPYFDNCKGYKIITVVNEKKRHIEGNDFNNALYNYQNETGLHITRDLKYKILPKFGYTAYNINKVSNEYYIKETH